MTTTTTGEPKDLAQLYAKIARITSAMKRVPKTGRNTFHKYDYATESDIVDAIRTAMGEEKLAIIPSVDRTERVEPDITRLFMTFTVACGDTGSSIALQWIGDGQDKADKGVYKAYTGAEKYFLMKLFLVATGDDPENDEPQPQPAQRSQPARPAPPVGRQVEQPAPVADSPDAIEHARIAFWTAHQSRLGAQDWSLVQDLLNTKKPQPDTVAGWGRARDAVAAALPKGAA